MNNRVVWPGPYYQEKQRQAVAACWEIIIRGTPLCLKMVPTKYRVGLIYASKRVTLGVKQKGIGGYSLRQSVLASYGKSLALTPLFISPLLEMSFRLDMLISTHFPKKNGDIRFCQ